MEEVDSINIIILPIQWDVNFGLCIFLALKHTVNFMTGVLR